MSQFDGMTMSMYSFVLAIVGQQDNYVIININPTYKRILGIWH
ncbi:hypothetical protein DSUL_40040 [Desulfovibrionales bacterium]